MWPAVEPEADRPSILVFSAARSADSGVIVLARQGLA
jgi:hypothetical protein